MQDSILTIRLYGDPCLRKKSSKVSEVGPSERILIESMIKTMHSAKGVGLAAPQVGINQRIFVADVGEGPMVFVNPRIIKKQGSAELEEGCLSIPGVTVNVRRPEKILIQYLDEHNNVVERNFENLMARVILHENDHLNGKMIVDYAGFTQKKELKKQLKEIEKQPKEIKE